MKLLKESEKKSMLMNNTLSLCETWISQNCLLHLVAQGIVIHMV